MKVLRHSRTWSFLIGVLLATTPTPAEPPRPQGDPQFWSNYNQGLMSLREGRAQDAIAPLTTAIRVTPDPRAYLAPAQWEDKQAAPSLASKRESIALEMARLQLDDQGDGAKLPRPAADFALLMQMLGRSAIQEANANHLDRAIADARAAAECRTRFAPGGNGELMFQAMLPDPHAPTLPVPAPVNGATLAAQACVTAGQFLKAQNKLNEANDCFTAATSLGRLHNSGTPRIGNARGETNYSQFATGKAVVLAWFELAKVHVATGNYQAAFDALNNAGENQPDRQTALEINDLMIQVTQHLNAQPHR